MVGAITTSVAASAIPEITRLLGACCTPSAERNSVSTMLNFVNEVVITTASGSRPSMKNTLTTCSGSKLSDHAGKSSWVIRVTRTPIEPSISISSPRANGMPWHNSVTVRSRAGSRNATIDP